MATGFKLTRKGITANLEPGERDLLRKLFSDVQELLEPETAADADPLAAMVGIDPSAVVPDDSALLRLLPNGIQGNGDDALEFRRFTERSLRESKQAALRAAALQLEATPLRLDTEQAQLFARALNDVRLVLGDRLGLEDDEAAERLHDITDPSKAQDVDGYLALVYNFVTWLQETLMQALLDSLN
ncbi:MULTISPECIES: DUF2017 domain-containing protein [unclassified Arthrobacter]|uniref:DUF2017 domain-containing protein n=1 Tax=unclassified Arthrobacter TaxID=235627 RepID=UPI0024DF7812|nr:MULTISPECIES: DUF2017 domain-containing protein [unclassified Arthrobacter]MCC9146577.1 DUF2017 domain-containing protein [Arthrobacter sp. zg-Y919]MDK1277807.1 DUF2017 domain-containing protein [Arthrobacter sp. zg.Y919]MDM7989694.1 DUF2017 domain-containing protein [Arthrobacter sp. zg-Y877]WIB02238.1 DUF2017 domain-containing protein [Arthrobacter sp. zg-Y919]